LTIKPVNQAPSFNFATNELVIAENAGFVTNNYFVTNINVGAVNQAGQTWTFAVYSTTNNATNATYAQFPAVSTNGTLIFRTGSYSFGTNNITVAMTTSGSTTNGGIISYTNSFQLDVVQVQYPPAITGLTNMTMLENATTNLSMPFTLFDPLTTNFNIVCTSADTNLVNISVSGVGTSRTLLFAPVTNSFGTNTVTVTVDDGKLTNSVTVTANVEWVNQAPSFNLAISSVTVNEYNQAVTIPSAVTNILAGPTNESNQTVSFVVTNNNTGLFLSPPVVSASGTLSFTPGIQGGTVTVGIRAVDNGGTRNGGVNTSPSQTLTITIPPNAFAYLTGSFTGLFYDTNTVANNSAGYFELALANDGSFNGYVLCAGSSNAFTGQFSISNSFASVATGNFGLNLTVDTSANWTESVSGTVTNTAGWNVPLESYLAGFSSDYETTWAGTYLAAMPGFDDPAAGPAGDSVFNIAISPNGTVAFTGYLADDTYVSRLGALSVNGSYPVYAPLYSGGTAGILIGWLTLADNDSDSLTGDSVLAWINQAGATALYPDGFTNQVAPVASPYVTSPTAILPFSSGTVVLSGGNLGTPITNSVAISDNLITADPSATNKLSLTINAGTGEILGSFVTGSNHTNYIDSAILQNNSAASGYFIGTSQGGWFQLNGN